MRVIGFDFITIGRENVNEIHNTLLSKGIYIIEDLDLSQVPPGNYEMVCLPLRLQGGDASPARAIIRPV